MGKLGAAGASSPLVYTQKSPDNTPQVHKRKTSSFKITKSSAIKQDEFGTFSASVLADRRYSPKKSRDKSIEASSSANLHNLLQSQHQNKQQQNIIANV